MNSAKEINQNTSALTVISKSKFIAYSFAVHSSQQVSEYLGFLKKEHSDATHICYAYKFFGTEKCFDDGEPQGTAGKPILDCIKKSGFENVLIAVVRYFGGIKLGAGGLLRAYSNSASNVLNLSGERLTFECKKISFCLDISHTKSVDKIKKLDGVRDSKIEYKEHVLIDIFCFENELDTIKNQIKNLTNQDVDFEISKDSYYI